MKMPMMIALALLATSAISAAAFWAMVRTEVVTVDRRKAARLARNARDMLPSGEDIVEQAKAVRKRATR